MAIKLVIVVSGGNVQSCYSTDDSIQIEMIDFDNLREQGKQEVDEAEFRVKQVAEHLHQVY